MTDQINEKVNQKFNVLKENLLEKINSSFEQLTSHINDILDRNKSSVDHKINCSIANDDIKSCVDQNINNDVSVPIKEKINQVTLNTDDEGKTTDTEKKELAQPGNKSKYNKISADNYLCSVESVLLNQMGILE